MDRRNFVSTILSSPLYISFLTECQELKKDNEFSYKYSVCNEIFEGWSLDRISRFIKPLSYKGIEIAPYTLAENVSELSPARRGELKKMMVDNGIECSGLHWLLLSPKGLHVTTADKNIRKKSWEYFRMLIDFCADLGGKVMILGSPQQRKPEGCSAEEAVKNLKDGLAEIAPYAEDRNIVVLIESMPRDCFVVTSMAEAVSMVEEINSPSIQIMMDLIHCINDPEPIDKLMHKYSQYIKHIHTHSKGTYLDRGPTDFLPVFRALKEINFQYWISLEHPDSSIGPEKSTEEAIDYYNQLEKMLI